MVCGCIMRRCLREGESPAERERKQFMVPVSLIMGTLAGFFFLLLGSGMSAGQRDRAAEHVEPSPADGPAEIALYESPRDKIPITLAMTCGFFLLWLGQGLAWFALHGLVGYTLVTKRLPIVTCEICLTLCCAAVYMMDTAQLLFVPLNENGHRTSTPFSIWPINVVVLDALLVLNTRTWLSTALCWFSLPYLMLKMAYGVGEPMSWFGGVCLTAPVILLDFWFTRGFAKEMRQQKAAVDSSVKMAELVTTHLSLYRTDAARKEIGGEGGDMLPPQLRLALETLVENLCDYKPFLPQSCLPDECADEEEEGGRHDEVSQRGRPVKKGDAPGNLNGVTVRIPRLPTPPSQQHTTKGRTPSDAATSLSGGESPCREGTGFTRGASMPTPVLTPKAARRKWADRGRKLSLAHSGRSGRSPLPRGQSLIGRMSLASDDVADVKTPMVKKAQRKAGLDRRQASLLVANLRGYLLFIRGRAAAQVHELHAGLLTEMMARTARHKALTDGISADRYQASGNGARACLSHRAAMVRLAWDVAGPGRIDLDTVARGCARAPPGAPPLALTAGVCSGEMLCGDIGCDGLRRYSFIGEAAAWAHAAERLVARWGCAAAANSYARDSAAAAEFSWRLRAAAAMAKPSHRLAQQLWELLASSADVEESNDEWMYQLERLEGCNKWRYYNAALSAHYAGDWEAAERGLAAGRAELTGQGDDELPVLYAALEEDVARRPASRRLQLLEASLVAPAAEAADEPGAAHPSTSPTNISAFTLVNQARKAEREMQKRREDEQMEQQRKVDEKLRERREARECARRGSSPHGTSHMGGVASASSLGITTLSLHTE